MPCPMGLLNAESIPKVILPVSDLESYLALEELFIFVTLE